MVFPPIRIDCDKSFDVGVKKTKAFLKRWKRSYDLLASNVTLFVVMNVPDPLRYYL